MNAFLKAFSDPQAVARYTDGPPRFVPGMADLHRMTSLLLAERVPADGTLLVLGAGGGLELKALADRQKAWTFEGVDPAAPMLHLAKQTLGPDAERVRLVEGYIEDASEGPFDGATCLLTLHFLDRDERCRTLKEIRRRLKPGAPFVMAHSSFPQDEPDRSLWLDRYAAFAVSSGVDPDQAAKGKDTVRATLTLLSPDDEEALLSEAGFRDVGLFYAGFTWRGWVAYA